MGGLRRPLRGARGSAARFSAIHFASKAGICRSMWCSERVSDSKQLRIRLRSVEIRSRYCRHLSLLKAPLTFPTLGFQDATLGSEEFHSYFLRVGGGGGLSVRSDGVDLSA